jgi:Predicted nucleoside-diphosphate sugar epimerase
MGDQNKAVVFGSSGLIGSAVCKELIKRGYSVTAVGRDREKVRQKVPGASEYYGFTGKEGDLEKIINGSIAVFNFSGAPIFKKWKGNYKTEIYESRVDYTSAIAEAIKKCQVPPELFVNVFSSRNLWL